MSDDRDTPKRTAALDAGQRRYFTGNECPAGHLTDRYTIDGSCVACRSIWNKQRKALARKKLGLIR